MTWVETFRFGPDVTAPAAARRFVAAVLDLRGYAPLIEDAELAVSEVVTNIVRHARSEGVLVIRHRPGGVRFETTDSGGGVPDLQAPTPEEPTGRGLSIVAHVADRWGVDPSAPGPGKTVWFELGELR